MRAARWTIPSLRLRGVVTGTSQLPAPFKPNPTLLRSPLPSQCPTECTEGILPHPLYISSRTRNKKNSRIRINYPTLNVVDADMEILPEDGQMWETLTSAVLPLSHPCGATAAAYTYVLRAR